MTVLQSKQITDLHQQLLTHSLNLREKNKESMRDHLYYREKGYSVCF